MVEVVHGISDAITDEDSIPALSSPRLLANSSHLVEDPITAMRRTTAAKRTLMKMRASRNAANRSSLDESPRDESKSPSSPNSSADEDPKRSKSDKSPNDESHPCKYSPDKPSRGIVPGNSQTGSIFQRRMRNHSAPVSLTPIDVSKSSTEIVCDLSRIPQNRLQMLLEMGPHYRPTIAFLYYVDPIADDKVDANLRNEAVHSLRFMHNAFFTLSAEAFCKAVNLIDRFIVKVKVKPKYMACVAAASYHIAAKLVELESGIPPAESLVQISHCGGTAADLLRMEQIMASKLGGDLNGVNAFDFLRLFASAALVLPEGTTANSRDAESPQGQLLLSPNSLPNSGGSEITPNRGRQSRRMYDIWNAMTNRLVVALCSLEIYRFTYQVVALAVLHHFNVAEVESLSELCKAQMDEVLQCSALVEELYDVFYRDSHPSRKALAWTLSKRTLMRLGCSSPTTLDTISEDTETDREDKLQFMFEP